MDFKLDDENLILKKYYDENDNYKVIEVGNSDLCYIFFSSNGLYFPNELECFEDTIGKKDRYEWWGVGHTDEIWQNAGRIIYVRDIYKQFYVQGINKDIHSIDALCEKLKVLSEGMRVITCGTSSGGYMAVIAGVYLQAECVFDFGGQWSLIDDLDTYYFLKKYETESLYSKYYDIAKLIKDNKTPIFYFYSALNEGDKRQVESLISRDNVFIFAMKSKIHGWLLFNSCYKNLLIKSVTEIKRIYGKYQGKLISQKKICFDLLKVNEALIEVRDDIIRNHKSLQAVTRLLK